MNITEAMITVLTPDIQTVGFMVESPVGIDIAYSDTNNRTSKILAPNSSTRLTRVLSTTTTLDVLLVAIEKDGYGVGARRVYEFSPQNLATMDFDTLPIVTVPLVSPPLTPFNTTGSVVDANGVNVTSTLTLITVAGKVISTTSVTGTFTIATPEEPYYVVSDDGNSVRVLERAGTITDEPLNFVMDATNAGTQYQAQGFVYDADGNPLGQTVVVTSTGDDPEVLGVSVSDSNTGAYAVNVGSWSEEVMAYTHQDYGILFTADVDVEAGSVVHPTTPNQYVYKIITSGTLPSAEPTEWPTEIRVFDLGTATAEPVKLLEPQMAGWFKTKAI